MKPEEIQAIISAKQRKTKEYLQYAQNKNAALLQAAKSAHEEDEKIARAGGMSYFNGTSLQDKLVKQKLSEWERIRLCPVTHETVGWMHIVHMVTISPITNCRFPAHWNKISASLVSKETANWTYGSMKVGFILDVPAQNILSTDIKNIYSLNGDEHVRSCSAHGTGECHITCYIRNYTIHSASDTAYDRLHAQQFILDPQELIIKQQNEFRNKLFGRHNEILLMGRKMDPEVLPNRTIYYGMKQIEEVKAKAIYLIVDKSDSQLTKNRNKNDAESLSRQNGNLPIFSVTV